jgi:hypothetical protein
MVCEAMDAEDVSVKMNVRCEACMREEGIIFTYLLTTCYKLVNEHCLPILRGIELVAEGLCLSIEII